MVTRWLTFKLTICGSCRMRSSTDRPRDAAARPCREAMQFKPLTTTTIGSFPRPAWLAATERSRATFRLEGEALREAQDDATLLTLRELGLDIVTDGE